MSARGSASAESLAARLGWRYGVAAGALTLLVGLALAIPTAIVPNPFFTRMTPVEPEQYAFWIATSLLIGALLATYLAAGLRRRCAGQSAGAGLLGVFAVGCPVCNKLIVALLGTSGALTYFAPIQPLLGAGAVALAAYGLWLRLRAVGASACEPRSAAARWTGGSAADARAADTP